MRIGIDFDGVVTDFHTEYIKLTNLHFNKNYPIQEARYWNTYDEFEDFTPEMQKEMFELIRNIKNFWFSLKPYDYGDIKKIKDYIWNENIVYFITNRYSNPDDDSTLMQCLRWLQKHGIESHGVILTRHKAKVCKMLKLDYFIDDKPGNAKDINAGGNTVCYLLDRKYNQDYETNFRVKSIEEFLGKAKERLR